MRAKWIRRDKADRHPDREMFVRMRDRSSSMKHETFKLDENARVGIVALHIPSNHCTARTAALGKEAHEKLVLAAAHVKTRYVTRQRQRKTSRDETRQDKARRDETRPIPRPREKTKTRPRDIPRMFVSVLQ